jgi:spore coat polysaccharide biosynthesis protein SpsF
VKTAVCIQVRLGSTRLPGKTLLPLAGRTVIEHVMRALRPVPADVYALLTDQGSAGTLRPLAAREGFAVCIGPEKDVLSRFCGAARTFDAGRLVRATGDNPLTSARLARLIMDEHQAAGADLSHYLGNPWGTGVEVVESTALFAAEKEAVLPEEREHATAWIYRHRERFLVLEPPAPADAYLPDARVTVDTPADLENVMRIFAELYDGGPIEADVLVRYLGGPVHA